MAKEDVQAFNKGFAALTKQMKENREAEEQLATNNFNIEMNTLKGNVTKATTERNKLEKKLSDANENDKKSLNEIKKLLKENEKRVALAQDAKTQKEEEIKTAEDTKDAMLKMRNLTEEQVQTEKEQIAEIADMKNAQKAYQEEYEKTEGAKATDSKIFNKTNLDIAQKELNMRKESAKRDGISKSGQEEIDKEQKRINTERGTVFGKMSNYMLDMRDNIKKVIGTAGKGLLGGAIFFAIGAFLQSETFQKIIDFIFDTLIPKLKFFYDSFLGPEGGIIKGFKEMFNDKDGIGQWIIAITGIVAAIVAFKFVGLALGIAALLGGLKSFGTKLFGGKEALVGKDKSIKGSKGIFSKLGSSLKGFMSGIAGFASKGLDMVKNAGAKLMDSAKNMAKGALDLAKKGVSALKTGGSKVVDATKKVGGGVKDLGKAMGKDVAKGGSKVASSLKGGGAKLTASASKAFKMFPRIGLAAKLVPGLGAILAAGQGISILMDDKLSKNDKIKAIGKLLGGSLGAAGFGALGAALGTGIFPGIGTIAGGIIGGALGYFGGDWAGGKAANFLLGEKVDEQKVAEELKAAGGMPDGPPQSQGSVVAKTPDMDISQGSTTANQKFTVTKGKPTESTIAARVKSGMTREEAESTPQTFKNPISGIDKNVTIIQNAPQNNSSVNNSNTTSTSSGFVEPDPMFRRNTQFAI